MNEFGKLHISTCVVIPCFNHGQYLDECLQSVFNQTRTDWEAIVVDDFSTDSYTISKIKAIKHPKVKVIHHAINRGLAAARNTGVRASDTPFCLMVDSDDKLHPKYLERTLNVLESRPEIDFVFGWLQCFGIKNNLLKCRFKKFPDELVSNSMPGAGTLMRRALWKRIGGYCEDNTLRVGAEDWEFWISAIEKGAKGFCIAKPLYFYRKHHESMWTRLNYNNHKTRIFIYRRHRLTFDRYSKKHEFLAEGYRRSSETSITKNKRIRAFCMALFAFIHKPSILMAKLLLRSVCPSSLMRIAYSMLGKNFSK